MDNNKDQNDDDSDMSSEDEYEELDELVDSFIPRDCKYLNRLDLVQFSGYTDRLSVLNHFVRSFIPHMGDLNKSGNLLYEDAVDKNVREAMSRALISALGQIGRIADRDLEPINVISPEIYSSDDNDSLSDPCEFDPNE